MLNTTSGKTYIKNMKIKNKMSEFQKTQKGPFLVLRKSVTLNRETYNAPATTNPREK